MNSEDGYNLEINDEYNPIVGDLFGTGALNPHWKDIDLGALINIMKLGFTKYGAAYILGVSHDTIRRRVEGLTNGRTYEEFQVELISPLLVAMVANGYTGEEISRRFFRLDIDQKDILTVERTQQIPFNELRMMNYNPQSIDAFLKPILLSFIKRGFTLDRIARELRDLKIINLKRQSYKTNAIKLLIPRLFDGYSIEKLRQISIEPIIENLIRQKDQDGNYLSILEIVIELGWCSKTSSPSLKQSMRDRLMGFLKSRWGFRRIADARRFFTDHYLGYHEYDNFYFD